MKRFIISVSSLFFSLIAMWNVSAQLDFPFSEPDSIVTQDISNVVWQGVQWTWEPLRDGAKAIAEWLWGTDEWIYFDEIDSTQTAWDRTSTFISTLLNYALAIIGLVVLAYLLYHWFLAMTARDDSEQLNKWMQWVKYAFFALVGIGTARFVISIILRFITLVTT